VPREQQQEEHRHHLVAADLSSLLFDAHEFGDEALAAIFAHGVQLSLHIAPHREQIWDHAQEADGAREAREAVCPSGELWPVGKWQAKKLANHRERQLSRVAAD